MMPCLRPWPENSASFWKGSRRGPSPLSLSVLTQHMKQAHSSRLAPAYGGSVGAALLQQEESQLTLCQALPWAQGSVLGKHTDQPWACLSGASSADQWQINEHTAPRYVNIDTMSNGLLGLRGTQCTFTVSEAGKHYKSVCCWVSEWVSEWRSEVTEFQDWFGSH